MTNSKKEYFKKRTERIYLVNFREMICGIPGCFDPGSVEVAFMLWGGKRSKGMRKCALGIFCKPHALRMKRIRGSNETMVERIQTMMVRRVEQNRKISNV